jgi:hypothetical protein
VDRVCGNKEESEVVEKGGSLFYDGSQRSVNQLSGAKFSVPCVEMTAGTGLKPGKWIQRLIALMDEAGITTGRLFQKRLDPPRLFEMEDESMILLEVQSSSDAIDEELNVRDRYGLERSLRSGVLAHAHNMGVDEDLIKAIN